MKRSVLILIGVIALAAGAFVISHVAGDRICCAMGSGRTNELAWLQDEFHLGEAEMGRISRLHESYRPVCDRMCVQLATQRDELDRALAGSTNVTPEIQRLLEGLASLHAECQTTMLRHFHEVAATMPPEPAKRYLDEMKRVALGIDGLTPLSATKPPGHEHH